MRALRWFRLLLLPLLFAACSTAKPDESADDYGRELGKGELGLVKLPASETIPDFFIGWQDREALADAVQYSLDYLAKPSSKDFFPYGPFSHEDMRASLARFQELLRTSPTADSFRESLVEEFEVWMARGRENTGDVLYTGYCRPIFDGSPTRQGPYQYPLYGPPDDLVKGEDGAILGRRTDGGEVVPYYTAAELATNGHLDGLELVYLDNAFEAYVAQVQGSAMIRFEDGRELEYGYAGKNGRGYVSIGQILIEEGKISRAELSLTTLLDYFADNPSEVDRVLPMNPNFVFFQEAPGGPYGSLGQPVTTGRSLATDKDVFPRAGLVYCEVRLPDFDEKGELVHRPKRFFALDQDRGGAIRSAGRCDVFMGTGDDALAKAGHVLSIGRMYYLFLKQGGRGYRADL